MKNVIGKYLFEVIVIFIGITSSFLFEEWRQNKEKNERSIEIMKSLLVELERNDSFISDIDTSYIEVNALIQKFLGGEDMTRPDVIDIAYMLMEGSSQYRLKDISSFIHGFSSHDQLNIINKNKEVLRYLTYMESLLTEHELTTNTLTESVSTELWPLLNKYHLTDDILNQQRAFLEFEEISLDHSKGDISEFLLDADVRQYLKWSQLKLLRLIQINQAIHMQIENIVRELNRTIEGT